MSLEHPTFEEWWEPFTFGVGPAGVYVAALDAERQAQLRERLREALPDPPFVLTARAWTALGIAYSDPSAQPGRRAAASQRAVAS